jgi:hypothetical protein
MVNPSVLLLREAESRIYKHVHRYTGLKDINCFKVRIILQKG